MVLYNNIKLTNQYTINLLKKLEETCIMKTYKQENINLIENYYTQIFQEKFHYQLRNTEISNQIQQLQYIQQHFNLEQFYMQFSLYQMQQKEFMCIDNKIIKSLSIFSTKGKSLYTLIKQFCVSQIGEKMLLKWIFQPSKSIREIQFRQTQCLMYNQNQQLLKVVQSFLNKIPNLSNLIRKIQTPVNQALNIKDCYQIYQIINSIQNLLMNLNFLETQIEKNIQTVFYDLYNQLKPLSDFLGPCIDLDNLNFSKEIKINPNIDNQLSQLMEQKSINEHLIEQLRTQVEQQFNIQVSLNYDLKDKISLEGIKSECFETLQNNPQFKSISYKKRSVIFTNKQLCVLSDSQFSIEKQIEQRTQEIMIQITEKVKQFLLVFQDACHFLSEQDIYIAFAQLLDFRQGSNTYCIPQFIIQQEQQLNILGGWHPCLENCIENNLILNSNEISSIILTGPNMGGKSTYLRTVGVITYLAHIGAPVPCQNCNLTIFEEIKTRVGSGDNTQENTSTFMNEMIEISSIINSSISTGLYLIDELGRGTSIREGISLSYAIMEQLIQRKTKFIIFATHFFELTRLQGQFQNVKNFYMDCYQEQSDIHFSYKVKEGSVNKSLGIDIIQRLQFPQQIISQAKEILSKHEKQQN